MALLKRIQASTLMETLVATVLIVVLFLVAGLLMNSLFAISLRKNSGKARQYLYQMEYRYQNENLTLPWHESRDGWEFEASAQQGANKPLIIFKALNKETKESEQLTTLQNPKS